MLTRTAHGAGTCPGTRAPTPTHAPGAPAVVQLRTRVLSAVVAGPLPARRARGGRRRQELRLCACRLPTDRSAARARTARGRRSQSFRRHWSAEAARRGADPQRRAPGRPEPGTRARRRRGWGPWRWCARAAWFGVGCGHGHDAQLATTACRIHVCVITHKWQRLLHAVHVPAPRARAGFPFPPDSLLSSSIPELPSCVKPG